MAKKQDNKRWLTIIRNILFWVVITLFALMALALSVPQEKLKDVPFSDVVEQANAGKIEKIEIEGNDMKVTPKGEDKATQKSYKEEGSSIYEQGLDKDADVTVEVKKPSSTGSTIWNLASLFLPILLIGGLFWFMFRQAQGQSSQALGFGRSKARLYGTDKEKVVFDDIAGNGEAKEDLFEVVDFLKHPKKYQSVGAKIPTACLILFRLICISLLLVVV